MADVVAATIAGGLPLCRRVSAPGRAVPPFRPRRPRQGGSAAPRRTLWPRLAAAPARAPGLGACGQRRRDQRHPAADRAADRHRPCRRVHHDHRHLGRHRRQASAAPAPCISSRRSIWRPSSAAFSPTGGPNLAIFVESEMWPTMVRKLAEAGIPLVVANARLSERSFRGWRRFAGFASTVFPQHHALPRPVGCRRRPLRRARRARRAHRRQPQVRRSAACRRQRRRRPPDGGHRRPAGVGRRLHPRGRGGDRRRGPPAHPPAPRQRC